MIKAQFWDSNDLGPVALKFLRQIVSAIRWDFCSQLGLVCCETGDQKPLRITETHNITTGITNKNIGRCQHDPQLYIYIYIYIIHMYTYMYIYIYIHTHTYIERERDTHTHTYNIIYIYIYYIKKCYSSTRILASSDGGTKIISTRRWFARCCHRDFIGALYLGAPWAPSL